MIDVEFIGDEVQAVRRRRQPLARAIGLGGSDKSALCRGLFYSMISIRSYFVADRRDESGQKNACKMVGSPSSRAIVRAWSKVASRNGATGCEVMRLSH
jgi:hypothetical protein